MSGSTTGSWDQYSEWMVNIARSMRINPPAGAEITALETFNKHFYDPDTGTGTRTWLSVWFNKRSVSPSDDYIGDPDTEPSHVDVQVLKKIGYDLKKIPMTEAEKGYCDTLIAATGNRKYNIYP